MSKFTDAANLLKRQAVKYEAFVSAAKLLDEVGSIEGLAGELRVAADAAAAERDAAKADVAKAKADIAKAKEKAEALVAEAAEQAKVHGASIVKAAEETAANVLKKAQDESAEMMAKASTQKARLSSEIGGLQSAIESAKTELATFKAARDEALAATQEAEKKLEGIKTKLKSLLA